MLKTDPRPLSPSERALISRLLERTAKAEPLLATLESLRVVGTCECGCGSIDLVSTGNETQPERSSILADAYGTVQGGHAVGLILWGTAASVSGLEVYSLGFDPPFALPEADSVSDIPAGPDPAV